MSGRLRVTMIWLTIFLAILSPVSAIAGVMVSGQIQRDLTRQQFEEQKVRENIAYTRQIAEARRDRLVKRYDDLVVAARTYVDAIDVIVDEVMRPYIGGAYERPVIPESAKKDFWEIYSAMEQVGTELQRSLALVEIEDEHNDIVQLCGQLVRAARDLLQVLPKPTEKTLKSQEDLSGRYNELVTAVRTHLRELEHTV